jgi:hypothetical protein
LVHAALDRGVDQSQSLGHDQQHRDLEVPERPDQHGRLAAHGIDDARSDRQRRHEAEDLLVEVR